jgi:DNA-binding response OmpR family regulator
MARILVVDDDPDVILAVQRVLEQDAHAVVSVRSGAEGLDMLARDTFDLVVLDVIMPEMSGVEVCRRIRSNPAYVKIPVLFLTARGRPNEIVEGLDAGADDYLVKPFAVIELPARVRALLRRGPQGALDPEVDWLNVGSLVLYSKRLDIEIDGRAISLTPIEHRLLHVLMMNAGRPLPAERLLEDVWEYPPGVGDPRLVRVHITNLRAKLQPDPDSPSIILNLHGQGYMISSS